MKPPPFDYVRAADLGQALDLLVQNEDEAKVVAGGQSLVPLLNLRLARPGLLIDINDLPLDQVRAAAGELVTGALVRHRVVASDPLVCTTNPLLARAAGFIGHTAIRNRGTIGGSLAHADPAAEMPLIAVACGATVQVRSATGEREIAAADFFTGPFMTDLEAAELVIGVRWPALGSGDSWGFQEIAERSGDFAAAAAAVVLRDGGRQACVAVTGVPGSPTTLSAVEQLLEAATRPTPDELRQITREALAQKGGADGSPEGAYVRHLVEEMVMRAAVQAIEGSGA